VCLLFSAGRVVSQAGHDAEDVGVPGSSLHVVVLSSPPFALGWRGVLFWYVCLFHSSAL
jgi:hypothetical protein